MKILVVDDYKPTRTIVARTLTEVFACPVVVAAGGEEALEICRTGDIEILLTDFDMKRGMDGVTLASAVSSLANPPIVVLMTDSSWIDKRAAGPNIFAILKKPFPEGDLLGAIRQAAQVVHVALP